MCFWKNKTYQGFPLRGIRAKKFGLSFSFRISPNSQGRRRLVSQCWTQKNNTCQIWDFHIVQSERKFEKLKRSTRLGVLIGVVFTHVFWFGNEATQLDVSIPEACLASEILHVLATKLKLKLKQFFFARMPIIIRSQNAKNVFFGFDLKSDFLSFDLQIEFHGQGSKKKP